MFTSLGCFGPVQPHRFGMFDLLAPALARQPTNLNASSPPRRDTDTEVGHHVCQPSNEPPCNIRHFYQPLDSSNNIRVFSSLNPGIPTDPLSGELHHIDLSDLGLRSQE